MRNHSPRNYYPKTAALTLTPRPSPAAAALRGVGKGDHVGRRRTNFARIGEPTGQRANVETSDGGLKGVRVELSG